jgi:hypothetical protein
MIAVFNNISDPGRIEVGQELVLPLPPAQAGPDTDDEPVIHNFTHQQLINAFYYTYRDRDELDKYWDAIVKVGLSYIANDRSARYTGPDISTLSHLPDEVKSSVLDYLNDE